MHRTFSRVALVGFIAIAMLLCAGCTTTPSGNATPSGTAVVTGTPTATAGTVTILPTITGEPNATPTIGANETPVVEPTETPGLMNTTWEWTAIETMDGMNQTVVTDSNLHTLVFNPDGSYGIKNDCNVGGGNYTLVGSSLNLTAPITTLVYCGDESHDQLYLASLLNVTAFTLADTGRLSLALGESGQQMVFRANATVEEAPVINASFVNKTWHWTGMTQTMPSKEVAISNPNQYTIVFAENGTYAVKADCNTGTGNFTLEKTVLKISKPSLTTAYCGDRSADRDLLDGLSRVKAFQTDSSGRLILTMENPNNRLVFKP
ncbi:META domain protein [anaerobic digester metagenome]